jgi:hypothetical protein
MSACPIDLFWHDPLVRGPAAKLLRRDHHMLPVGRAL